MAGASGATAAVVLVRAREPEAEGATESHRFLGIPIILWQTVNLGLFLFLLVKLLRKPIAGWLSERREGVARQIRETEEKRQRSEAIARDLSERLGRIEGDLAELRSHSEKEAAAEQAAFLAQTEEETQRIVQRAAADIEVRVKTARRELTAYAGDLAVGIAAELVKKSLTPEDQARLLREGIEALAPGREKG